MGASKKDIRRIFTAETAIEGFISGVLGIAITLLATLPINAIVAKNDKRGKRGAITMGSSRLSSSVSRLY